MRNSHELIIILSVLLFINLPYPTIARASEGDLFKEIENLAEAGKTKDLLLASKKFLSEYPKSNLIADVRFIMAENESDPVKAIEQFEVLINKYSYFKRRDLARYKICEILYLQSKWKDLELESRKGIKYFDNSEYLIKFKFMLVRALIRLEQFDSAKEVCLGITKHDHNYNTLSDALMLLSYINRNIYGLSKSYLFSLNEIITGFVKSNNMPAALFLLGRYYESMTEYNKAFSAYSDVVTKFPKSPESEFSKKQLSGIMQHHPQRTVYIPDASTIKKTDKINIQPEIDIEEEKKAGNSKELYSISLGPFNNINHAREIENLLKKDFLPLEMARTRNGFIIYIGKFTSTDSAVEVKIRLAEEFGINGKIVKIIKDSKKLYIYEE